MPLVTKIKRAPKLAGDANTTALWKLIDNPPGERTRTAAYWRSHPFSEEDVQRFKQTTRPNECYPREEIRVSQREVTERSESNSSALPHVDGTNYGPMQPARILSLTSQTRRIANTGSILVTSIVGVAGCEEEIWGTQVRSYWPASPVAHTCI